MIVASPPLTRGYDPLRFRQCGHLAQEDQQIHSFLFSACYKKQNYLF